MIMSPRTKTAPMAQKILTDWGCVIKTRLGLHSGVLDQCTESGLIFLELVGEREKHEELLRKLNLLEGVQAKLVGLSLPDQPTPAAGEVAGS